jgi:hypothetical protein
MKAAIVRGAGQMPVYGDFAEPGPSPGDKRIAVTAAAISHIVKSRASGTHYTASEQFPFVIGIDGVGHSMTQAGCISSCQKRRMAAWRNAPWCRRPSAWSCLTTSTM